MMNGRAAAPARRGNGGRIREPGAERERERIRERERERYRIRGRGRERVQLRVELARTGTRDGSCWGRTRRAGAGRAWL